MKEPTEIIVLKTCECGCGCLTRATVSKVSRYIHGHQMRETQEQSKKSDPEAYHNQKVIASKKAYEMYPTLSRNICRRTNAEQKKKNPEKYYADKKRAAKLGGIAMHKKHPNIAKEFGEKTKECWKNPMYRKERSDDTKRSHKKRKAENPEKYRDHFVRMGKLGLDVGGGWKTFHKKWKKRDPEGHSQFLANSTEEARLVNTDWDFYNDYGTTRSKYPYGKGWTRKFKEQIRKRDDYKCVITGMTNEEHKAKYGRCLTVHHWNYDKDETNPFYFVTVTCGINTLANKNRAQWTDCFNGIMEDKYCEIIRGK